MRSDSHANIKQLNSCVTTADKSYFKKVMSPKQSIVFYLKSIGYLAINPREVSETAKILFKTFYVFRRTPIKELKQIYRIVILKGFFLRDAFRWGLLNPEVDQDEIDKNIATRIHSFIRSPYNHQQCRSMTNDKSIFHKYCTMLNIPTPNMYAAIYPQKSGWTYEGKYLRSQAEWAYFIQNQLPQEFVIKPMTGTRGKAIQIFEREGTNFYEISSRMTYTANDLYTSMTKSKKYDSYIIQERVYNHDDIRRINNSNFLQTLRIVSVIDKNGRVKVPFATLKVNNSDYPADNYYHGITGNYCCLVEVESGKITECYIDTDSGYGPKLFEIHPETKVKLKGYQLPYWDQVLSVIKDAAQKFTPPRSYGWDVAITQDGPLVIEANMNYFYFRGMGSLQKVLIQDL
jgi:hypothetical protein